MSDMNEVYGRDLDLNLLRVFVVVAATGSVTRAAAQLYLTQPAVSAALRRLSRSVDAELFVRSGRGLKLTPRGQRLFESARPLLQALVDATLSPPRFDPAQSESVIRLGLSDGMEGSLLPRLLQKLARVAPRMRLVCLPVQFRTVEEALGSRAVDVAVSVADELPPSIARVPLYPSKSRFVCLYDPRHGRLGQSGARVSEREYFERDHVIVSYNADLRGFIEDLFHKQRRVRCSVASFSHLGSIVEGSSLVATVPEMVANHIVRQHPKLAAADPPFALQGTGVELLWPKSTTTDETCRFVRDRLLEVAHAQAAELALARRKQRRARNAP